MVDPVTTRVYKWEGKWGSWKDNKVSLVRLRQIVKHACQSYGLKSPPVVQHPTGTMTYYWESDDNPHISFSPTGKDPSVALHEAAHYIAHQYFGSQEKGGHTPRWLGIYRWLLIDWQMAPKVAIDESMKSIIKMKWAKGMSPKALKRRRNGIATNRRTRA
jgi:hypothetical protein